MAFARSDQDRFFLGVCGGLSAAFRLPSGWMRLAFVIAALASGVGILLYILLAFFMLPPGFDEGPLSSRLRANGNAFLEQGRAVASRLAERIGEMLGAFQVADLRARTFAQLGGGLFLLGLFILLLSLDLLWWLTFWRALALCLILIGLGMLSRAAPPRQE